MNMPTRETGTILAALRLWQIHLDGRNANIKEFAELVSIATDGYSFAKLSAEEIDGLCETLNLDDAPEKPEPLPDDEKYREYARGLSVSSGESFEVDQDAIVSKGDDPGRYVAAWVWVTDDQAGNAIASALFERFEIEIPEEALDEYPKQGECGPWVHAWKGKITRPTLCTAETLAAELKEYGAWDAAELADDGKNWERILWLAGGQIRDERYKEERQS